MGPEQPLPLPPDFTDPDDFVQSLLHFTTSSWLLQTLCGGVHILDFYTRSPDLYSTILPQTWRDWFKSRDIMDILDFLMREDLSQFEPGQVDTERWRDGPLPPMDLLQYVKDVRKHLLAREFPPKGSGIKPQKATLPRHIALGMKVKKVHEVDNFARYVDRLASEIAAAKEEPITHLVDFGSGQNYLGRALAAPPYSRHIVAVESKQHNIEGAKNMDVLAKLVPKPLVMRNKKEYRAQTGKGKKKKPEDNLHNNLTSAGETGRVEPQKLEVSTVNEHAPEPPMDPVLASLNVGERIECNDDECVVTPTQTEEIANTESKITEQRDILATSATTTTHLQVYTEGQGSVQYVEHIIKDGDLTPVIDQVVDTSQASKKPSVASDSTLLEQSTDLNSIPTSKNVNAMVISLHSCGNLVHYGLRSLLLNPHISAVAMVGCCYNLVTERLGPPTYKLPTLRPNHPRLISTSNAFDPNGFPMSEKLATYPLPHTPAQDPGTQDSDAVYNGTQPQGIRLNITARMMAVQAPFNWGPSDSETFFTRHFFRALLQRIFLDRGIISAPVDAQNLSNPVSANGHTSHVTWTPPNGRGPGLSSDGTTTPLTIGTLRKFAYSDFVSYVRAAVGKLTGENTFCEVDPDFIREKMEGLTDGEIRGYEEAYKEKKKELSVMWSLMAFSAGVVESVVVVDRWLWLKEQESVGEAWVESVFEYQHSPRNLVVVGVKK